MASDLVQLVAELLEKRPELAERLPGRCQCDQAACVSWTTHKCDEEFGESTAREIVHGVCAREIVGRYWIVVASPRSGVEWWAEAMGEPISLGTYPDFTTALVRATIAAKEADRAK